MKVATLVNRSHKCDANRREKIRSTVVASIYSWHIAEIQTETLPGFHSVAAWKRPSCAAFRAIRLVRSVSHVVRAQRGPV